MDTPGITIRGIAQEDVEIFVPPGGTGLTISADGVVVENITVTGGSVSLLVEGSADTPVAGGGISNVTVRQTGGQGDKPTQSAVALINVKDFGVDQVSVNSLTDSFGISLDHTEDCTVSNNSVVGILGHYYDRAGIRINNSQNVLVHNNVLQEIVGKDCPSCGSHTALAAGVWMSSSKECVLTDNQMQGIAGGAGWKTTGSGNLCDGRAGTGILFSNVTASVVSGNVISDVHGGEGYEGLPDGDGGVGSGVYMTASTGNIFSDNIIDSVSGGAGGTGSHPYAVQESGFGFWFDEDSLDNQVDTSNTHEGQPVVYLYGQSGRVIQGLTLDADANPTNWGKMTVVESSDVHILDNVVAGYTAAIGQEGAGIRLIGSSSCVVSDNSVSAINGGSGGTGHSWGLPDLGRAGAGLHLHNVTNSTFESNKVLDIHGGAGGRAENCCAWSGNGGLGLGVYLSQSTGNQFFENELDAEGGEAGLTDYVSRSGDAQVGFGFYFEPDALDNEVDASNSSKEEPVVYLYGADGDVVEDYGLTGEGNTTNLGKIVVIESTNIEVIGNEISGFRGAVAREWGMAGEAGSGSGGDAVGLLVRSCANITIADNSVSDIRAGNGWSGSCQAWCKAGTGGQTYAMLLEECSGCAVRSNLVEDCHGGQAGRPGTYEKYGGDGGAGHGIALRGCVAVEVEGSTVRWIRGGAPGEGDYDGESGQAFGFDLDGPGDVEFNNNQVAGVIPWDGTKSAPVAGACLRMKDYDDTFVRNFTCAESSGTDHVVHGVWLDGPGPGSVQLVNSIISDVSGNCLASDPENGPMSLSAVYSAFHACTLGTASNAALAATCMEGLAPQLADPEKADLHLLAASPFIDAGKPTDECSEEPEPNGCRVNLGAYGNTAEATGKPGAEHCDICPGQ